MAPRMDRDVPYPVRPLSGGYHDAVPANLIADGQTPDCENIEFDRSSLCSAGGVIKMNSQPGRKAAIRTRVFDGKRLSVADDVSVPLRGYAVFPYSPDVDQLGGDFATGGEDFFGGVNETFHARRGKSFEVNVTFQVPIDQALFSQEATDNYPQQDPNGTSPGAGMSEWQFDQAFEDTFIVLQKGGDRLAPMSWALGVTYVSSAYEDLTGQTDKELASRYRLVFMWLDAAGWGEGTPTQMRYSTINGVDVATAGEYSTSAYRCILTDCAIEPGRSYSVAVQLKLDSGSAGTGATPSVSWNDDGEFNVIVSTDAQEPVKYTYTQSSSTASGLYVWKGPTDSLDYLTKYGIRFSGRDAMFAGLGLRNVPWDAHGFIPYGIDACAMEKGGFQFVDWSQVDLGALGHDMEATHTAGDAYFEINRDFVGGTLGTPASQGLNPMGPLAFDVVGNVATWAGQGFSGTVYNSEALRGYRLIFADGSGTGSARADAGGIFSILSFSLSGSSHRLNIHQPNGNLATFDETEYAISAFRWNQRELIISDVRIYSTPRDYSDPAVKFSFITEPASKGDLEPNSDALLARWALDDGGGSLLVDSIGSRDGFLAPFGMGQSDTGTRGNKRLFLSGEGEAIELDLSENPVFAREFQAMMQGNSGGFAVEMTFQESEASYAVSENVTVNGITEFRGRFVSNMMSWTVKSPEDSGAGTTPKPLLVFGHQNYYLNTGSGGPGSALPFRRPQGFSLRTHQASDESGDDLTSTLRTRAWTGAGTANWSTDAPWVGNTVTIQVGIEPTTTDDQFRVYIAATPKALLNPKTSDPAAAEFAYFDTITIPRKDLLRSVITIGGLHDPEDAGLYEANWRGIVDEVRVFGTAAPGNLPAQSSQPILDGNGKILGTDSYPGKELSLTDMLRTVGQGLSTADLTAQSSTVNAPPGSSFFTAGVVPAIDSIDESYLYVNNDLEVQKIVESVPDVYQGFYHVSSVAADGATLSLSTPYPGETRKRAPAQSLRIIGYTSFADDLYGREALTLGSTEAFVSGTSRSKSAVRTGNYFANLAPLGAHWAVRIFSPGSNPLPGWVEAPKPPRSNPILGMGSINDLLFAGAGSCFYRVDDRWNPPNEIDETATALRFYARADTGVGTKVPLAGDGVRLGLPASDKYQLNSTNLGVSTDERTRVWDICFQMSDAAGIQTLLWCGSESSNAGRDPTNTTGDHRLNHWIRLNNGQPEFLVGNTGSTVPNGGFYAASGSISLQSGVCYHMRWTVSTDSGWLETPTLQINGQSVAVSVNGVAVPGTAPQWVQASAMVSAGDTPTVLAGVARASMKSSPTLLTFTEGVIRGVHFKPQLRMGRIASFSGEISSIHSWYGAADEFTPLPNFSTDAPFYPGTGFTDVLKWDFSQGVGHVLSDSSGNNYHGVIESRPLIPELCDAGRVGDLGQWTMVPFGDRMIATNGNRPVVWRDRHSARGLGVRAPTTQPSFEFKRLPLWTPNVFVASATSGNDPMAVAAAGAAEQKNHYQTKGNNYITQQSDTEMAFEQGDYFVFKAYVKPGQIGGKRTIYDERISLNSGKAIEMFDGKLRVGWHDSYLKQHVYVETSKPVFRVNRWHYVYVRMKWPPQDVDEGNWLDSFFSDGNLYRVPMSGITGPFETGELLLWAGGTGVFQWQASDDSYIYYTLSSGAAATSSQLISGGSSTESGTTTDDSVHPSNCSIVVRHLADESTAVTDDPYSFMREPPVGTRAAVSFTTAAASNGEPGTGRVSLPAMQVTLSGSTVTTVANTGYFHGDMIGMQFHFKDGANAGKDFYILTVPAANQATISEYDGTAPAADGSTRNCGVFSTVRLVKSGTFDDSKQPEEARNPIHMFGSPLQRSDISGVESFVGEFGSVGFVTTANETFFEAAATDKIETGTDDFADNLHGTVVPGDLNFSKSTGDTFTVIQSSQPNADLEVALDSESSDEAETPVWSTLESTNLLLGRKTVQVVFRDREQLERSNGSPALTIDPSGEDLTNVSGDVEVLLTNVPISLDEGDIIRELYINAANSTEPQLVAELSDNESTSVAVRLADLGRGRPLERDNAVPPRCGVLGRSNNAMFFGRYLDAAGEIQRDGIRFSKPFFPGSVSYNNNFLLNAGGDDDITGLIEHNGRMLAYQRAGIYLLQAGPGVAVDQQITSGAGNLSPNALRSMDDRAYAIDDRGPHVYAAFGAQPVYLGRPIEKLLRDSIDKRHLREVQSAMNRRRSQYVFTAKHTNDVRVYRRISIEFDSELTGAATTHRLPGLHRYSMYRHPEVTSMASVLSRKGGVRDFVGGTYHGFGVWMDRDDTNLLMLGPDSSIWGDSSFTSSTGSSGSFIKVLGSGKTVDLHFGGARGANLRWAISTTDAAGQVTVRWVDGVVDHVAVDGSDYRFYLMDRLSAADVPQSGETVMLGRLPAYWRSKWFDFGMPHQDKQGFFLDVSLIPSAGTLDVFFRTDFSEEIIHSAQIDLTKARANIHLAGMNAFTHAQVEFSVPEGTSDIGFELTDLVWRLQVSDQR